MAYYAHLSPGTNVGQQPTDYADVNNSTYIDWAVPGAGTYHLINSAHKGNQLTCEQ